MRYRILVRLGHDWYIWQENLAWWQVELMAEPDMIVEKMAEEMAG